MSTLLRRIYFHSVSAGLDENGRQNPLDFPGLIDSYRTLDYANRGHWLGAKGVRRAIIKAEKLNSGRPGVIVAVTDKEHVPEYEKEDAWSELRVPKGGCVGYKSHAVVFGVGGGVALVGFLPSPRGPSIGHLHAVLTCRSAQLKKSLRFDELYRGDPIKRLEQADAGKVTFVLQRGALPDLRSVNATLADTFDMLANQYGGEVFELSFGVKRLTKRNALLAPAARLMKDIVALRKRHPKDVTKVKAKIKEGTRSLVLDLLTDKFVIDVTLPALPGRDRYNNDVAFQAIEEAYECHRDEIACAVPLMGAVNHDDAC